MMDILAECNIIKYSAYRTAAKLRALQSALLFDHVRLGVVSGVFYRHCLLPQENNTLLQRQKLENVVYDILYAAQKESGHETDVGVAAKRMVQFIHDVYDRYHSGVKVISAKVALTILSQTRLLEKYKYLFNQLADHNNCLTPKRMQLLLTEFAVFAEYLSEAVSFGICLIPSTLSSCFQHCDGSIGITEENFVCWLLNEPQMLVWLSTFYRFQTAEKVCHNLKCDYCKVQPIRGLRYMCLSCFKYNQCQTCFFLGRVNKRHKLTHPMQEYCYETSSREATCAFFKVIKNKFKRSPSRDLQYLPAEPQDVYIPNQYDSLAKSISTCSIYCSNPPGNKDESRGTYSNFHQNALCLNPQMELQSIIHNLEEENRQLLAKIEERSDKNLGNYLDDHKKQIGAQVERLKSLKFHLAKISDLLPHHPVQSVKLYRRQMCHLESTPLTSKSGKNYPKGFATPPGLDSISPIVQDVGRSFHGGNRTSLPNKDEMDLGNDSRAVKQNLSNVLSLAEQSVNDLSLQMYQGCPEIVPCSEKGIGGWTLNSDAPHHSVREINGDIESIIEKLQNVVSSNFSFEDALLFEQDNVQLQEAAAEMEGLLACLIQNIEHTKRVL